MSRRPSLALECDDYGAETFVIWFGEEERRGVWDGMVWSGCCVLRWGQHWRCTALLSRSLARFWWLDVMMCSSIFVFFSVRPLVAVYIVIGHELKLFLERTIVFPGEDLFAALDL